MQGCTDFSLHHSQDETSASGRNKPSFGFTIFGSFDSFPFPTDDFVISLSDFNGGKECVILNRSRKRPKERKLECRENEKFTFAFSFWDQKNG